jgi:hypothetical protein
LVEPSEALPTAHSTESVRIEYGDKRLERFLSLLRQMAHTSEGTASWTLVGEPLFVEVSRRDLDDVSAHKTPSKVVYRVTQTRTAKKFPDTLYA